MRIFTHRAVSNYHHRTSPPCFSPSNSTLLDTATAEALDDKALDLPRESSLWQDGTYTAADFTLKKTLGKGTSGTARLAVRCTDGFPVVLKDIELAEVDSDAETAAAEELKEVEILIKLNHPCIVSIFGAYTENTTLTIVMAFCGGGSLDKLIRDKRRSQKRFEELTVASWMVQILLALQYMHSHNILHRDLKPGNIFLTGDDMVKVGDFGMARILTENDAMAQTACGTPYYLSPEICQGNPYGPQNDLWATGVLVYELLTLRRPFEGRNLASVIMQICHTKHSYPSGVPLSRDSRQVVDALLEKEASKRAIVPQLLDLTWLQTAFTKLVVTHPSLGVMPHSNESCQVSGDQGYESSAFDRYCVAMLVATGSYDAERCKMIEQTGFGDGHADANNMDRRLVVLAKRAFGGRVLGELHERFADFGQSGYEIEQEVQFLQQLEAQMATNISSEPVTAPAAVEAEEKQSAAPALATWVPDESVSACTRCGRDFNLFCRRHHCRLCGQIFCSKCCDQKSSFPELGFDESVRACLICLP